MDIKKYYELFADLWRLFKKYSSPDHSELFWKLYAEDVKALDSKYECLELFRNLVLAVTKELERIEKQS